MRARFSYLAFRVVNSFWFLPIIMMIGAVILAVATLRLDTWLQDAFPDVSIGLLRASADSARDTLSVIATALITVTSLVFSMTLIVLTIATGQLGPRLIAIFKADRTTQVVLGIFVSTFIFSLLLLRWVVPDDVDPGASATAVSLTLAQLLALISLIMLVYFVHHLSEMLQADTVISLVGRSIDRGVESEFPPVDGGRPPEGEGIPEAFDRLAVNVLAPASGYLQTLDRAKLFKLAVCEDALIAVQLRPGEFVLRGAPIARVWPMDTVRGDLKDRIAGAFVLGPKRTPAEDLEYAMNAVVEIACRALSPGVNDPFTAVACIDRLTDALGLALRRLDPPGFRHGEDGRLRVLWDRFGFADLLNGSFNPIRRSAAGNVLVLQSMIQALARLAPLCADRHRRDALVDQKAIFAELVATAGLLSSDRQALESQLAGLDAALHRWD
ncbi:MAG: DUF2254 domain-containing protein [Rhodospirillaceae bacterium]|nr:DUF2254 domain-containing protein [Rhodospirillaceae bacterium]